MPLSGELATMSARLPEESGYINRLTAHAEILENIIEAIANETDYILSIKPRDDEVYYVNTDYLRVLTLMGMSFGRYRIKEAVAEFDKDVIYWRGKSDTKEK